MRVILLSDLLRMQSPKVVCTKCRLNECNNEAVVDILCLMQFVADVLTSVVAFQLVNYHQRPVDDSFKCL